MKRKRRDKDKRKKKKRKLLEKELRRAEMSRKSAWVRYFNARDELFEVRETLQKTKDQLNGFNLPKHLMDLLKETLEKDNCGICLEKIKKETVYITKCGHYFCFTCLKGWFDSKKKTCPTCRAFVSTKI